MSDFILKVLDAIQDDAIDEMKIEEDDCIDINTVI